MRVVGLTGGMGAGKSTVAGMLAAHGAHVVDADAIAREVVQPGEPALRAIAEEFGDDVITADGELDRAAMASLVFADDERRAQLERITHPAIRARIRRRFDGHRDAEAEEPGQRVVVLDHPLLVESGLAASMATVVVVEAPEEDRVARLAAGRGIDPEDARARIATQADDEQRRAASTHLVRNDGDLDALRDRVRRLWNELADGPSG